MCSQLLSAPRYSVSDALLDEPSNTAEDDAEIMKLSEAIQATWW